jgi:hypothetical protein
MPDIGQDTGMRSESFTVCPTGRKLYCLSGRMWVKNWILPASKSPRIRGDIVEARVPFQVENQKSKTLSGDALRTHRGWLSSFPQTVGPFQGLGMFWVHYQDVALGYRMTPHWGWE